MHQCTGELNKKQVAHASELPLLFGPVPAAAVEEDFANQMLDFYINFVNDLDPGGEQVRSAYQTCVVIIISRTPHASLSPTHPYVA